jgi:hypothetical protein
MTGHGARCLAEAPTQAAWRTTAAAMVLADSVSGGVIPASKVEGS